METPTIVLHRLTSYEPGREWDRPVDDPRVLQGLELNDLSRLPWFFKRYAESLPRTPLPRELPSTGASCIAVLAGAAGVASALRPAQERSALSDLDLPHLARLLYLSAGVVRTMERPYGIHPFRAAGSAGARFPLEVYVSVPYGASLPAGVHWYDAQRHELVKIGPPPDGGAPALIVTGVPWRTGWRYAERGFRHVYWDAGTMLAQTLAAAGSAGLTARLYTRFPDDSVGALVGADGVHEWPVAVLALGDGAPALDATGPAANGEVDASPIEFPLVTAAQNAGTSDALGSTWDPGAALEEFDEEGGPVESVVLARGSQRRMDAGRGLPQSFLRTSLRVALRGVELPHLVVVHHVDGLAPGVYRWPDLSVPVRSGRFRQELYRICLEQGLARDAAFVVISVDDVGALDDRAYREAHLTAGLVGGRLHLLAYAQGAGASGMTFIDSEIAGLVGTSLDALLFTCVGVPEYASKRGGSPGAPTMVRRVEPRL